MYNIEWDYFSRKNSSREPFRFSIQEKVLPLIFGVVFILVGIGIFFLKYLLPNS
jgi:cell division protein FtsL